RHPRIPESLWRLIEACWHADPVVRPDMARVCTELQAAISEWDWQQPGNTHTHTHTLTHAQQGLLLPYQTHDHSSNTKTAAAAAGSSAPGAHRLWRGFERPGCEGVGSG
ncbi:hypothetical protein Agub_g11938, partial [Astrephomene gubernaculifera]